jgi:hypothetical protein
MSYRKVVAFRDNFYRYAFRSVMGLAVTSPLVAMLQGKYYLDEFRKNHREMPFPEMPCSGAVVAVSDDDEDGTTGTTMASSSSSSSSLSWFRFLLSNSKDPPQPLRLLVVGDSLAAGVGVTKSGTPVLPEAIAKTLSSALGGRPVHWTCMGEPGLSSPQIVKELILAEQEDETQQYDDLHDNEERVDIMEELQDWWRKRRQLQHHQEQQEEQESREKESPTQKVKAWWNRTKSGARRDIDGLRDNIHWRDFGRSLRKKLGITKRIPEPAVVLPQGRNTVVPDLVAQYDVAVVITGFNDLKNLIFPLPQEKNSDTDAFGGEQQSSSDTQGNTTKQGTGRGFERDLWSLMGALRGKMRNYDDEDKGGLAENTAPTQSTPRAQTKEPSIPPVVEARKSLRRHHPMVVFPAVPLFNETIFPLSSFTALIVKLMEYQKKKLAERYPAPVLFLEAPDDKTIKDFTNKRGPLWEARSREEVLFELTNKARLEQLEKLMKEYYDMWTVDVEEEEATYTYDAFGPDIQGPLEHLHRSPLISVDRVHPSDEGYELWGRHIAQAIVKEWDRRDGEEQKNLKERLPNN